MKLTSTQGGKLIWRDVMKDEQAVKSPVDIDTLPVGVYRLVVHIATTKPI